MVELLLRLMLDGLMLMVCGLLVVHVMRLGRVLGGIGKVAGCTDCAASGVVLYVGHAAGGRSLIVRVTHGGVN